MSDTLLESTITPAATSARDSRRVWLAFAAVSICFLIVNVLTADRHPTVWTDEVMFVDPAANVVLGRGYHSTAWAQPSGETFAGNSPLYTWMLIPWMSLFGVSAMAARSMNFVLMVATVGLILNASRKLRWVTSFWGGLLLVGMLYGGHVVAFSVRSGRYDVIGMLICAGIFRAFACDNARLKLVCCFLLGALLPWAGLQLIAFAGAMGMVLFACLGMTVFWPLAAVAVGIVVGGGAMVASLMSMGLWLSFKHSVLGLSDVNVGLIARLSDSVIGALRRDPTSVAMLLATCGIVAWRHLQGGVRWRSVAVVGLVVVIVAPVIVGAAGKMPIYYGWMRFIPLAVVAAATWEWIAGWKLARVGLGVLMLLSTLALPARLAQAFQQWSQRDYAPMQTFLRSHLGKEDVVFGQFATLYAARPVVREIYFPGYINVMSDTEKRSLNVLILRGQDTMNSGVPEAGGKTVSEIFGTDWALVDTYGDASTQVNDRAEGYYLKLYRRTGDR